MRDKIAEIIICSASDDTPEKLADSIIKALYEELPAEKNRLTNNVPFKDDDYHEGYNACLKEIKEKLCLEK